MTQTKKRRPMDTRFSPRALAEMEVGVTMPVLARAYRAAADQAVAHLGISQALAWPLVMINRHGAPLRLGVLADLLGIEAPSLARTVEQLVNHGYVTRQDDPEDKRAKLIDVTPQGTDACRKVEEGLKSLRTSLFAGATDAELEACLNVFHLLQKKLGASSPVLPVNTSSERA